MTEHVDVEFPDGTVRPVRVVAWERDTQDPIRSMPVLSLPGYHVEASISAKGLTYHAYEDRRE